ncbi:MAG: CYTH domain-containing protein [Flavobacteriaceae bacterium]|jgi:adenylate cyclase|nr:CYTH domain-containing protein [Flavobacteriaceae bacterium]
MAQEIEHKFLVKGDFKKDVFKSTRIVQGYLSSVPERTVRIRVKDTQGFITIKGIGTDAGLSRYEWEKEISVEEANDLLKICEPGVIDKVRHLANIEGFVYEVDEFHGDNEGLTVAELEVPDVNTVFAKPTWLGEEVTGQVKYYNSMLMKNPYKNW